MPPRNAERFEAAMRSAPRQAVRIGSMRGDGVLRLTS
jgi:hypothetical protein